MDVPCATVDYIRSNALQRLCVLMDYDQYIVYDYTKDEITPERPHQPYFLSMLHLLPSVPPPVLDIEIKVRFRYYHYPAAVCQGLSFFFSQVYHPSLVSWLESECLLSGTQATVTFDIFFDFKIDVDYNPDIFQEECEPYLRSLLSPLNRIDGAKLDIRISGAGFWQKTR